MFCFYEVLLVYDGLGSRRFVLFTVRISKKCYLHWSFRVFFFCFDFPISSNVSDHLIRLFF